jgi:phage gp36-like protein
VSAYATANDVRLAADPSFDPANPAPDTSGQSAASLSDTQLADAIGEASALIDSFIGSRYTTPVGPVDPAANPLTYPDPIRQWARDIALYLATLTWLRRDNLEPTDPVALRYALAMATLTAVRDGKASLPNLPSADTGGGGFAGITYSGSDGIFDAADAGFHRDAYAGRGPTPWEWGVWP